MVVFPPVPPEVKPLAHLLKLAEDHDERNIVVAYWARMSACLLALRLVPGKKSPATAELIRKLLDWLEKTKQANQDNEESQALIEEYALSLFEHGDQQDKAEIFNKNTVKTFYTTGMLMDYAKWKAAYIHNCLKAGEIPLPGPPRPPNDPGTGIVHNSTLSEEELASYQKYTGPIPFGTEGLNKLPTTTPDENIGLNLPKPDDNFSHAPASSPITPPVAPQQPAPFSPPPTIASGPPATILLPAPCWRSREPYPRTDSEGTEVLQVCYFCTKL
ncbi:hypothetical protein NQ317_002406 [Molorchus minor]|uniref:Vta1/callose synthase N-terminal domain-containing protein n=1 Tax=Molorchus minor TaxID=1323400 RepID=A0ABQ9JLM3_9CUCU|nr:hypothetical protein NQ317_002406 [Molorchus minor]